MLEVNGDPHILVTGGAGYIGSVLTGELLRKGYKVTVVDNLLFGGDSLMAHCHHPGFHFIKGDVSEPRVLLNAIRSDWPTPAGVVHLAGIVGFPACIAAGKSAVWRQNVEATKRVFDQSEKMGASRLVFSSTYANYGISPNGEPVTEASPLNPQSLYAESKIAAEDYLLGQNDTRCAPLVFRFATLYGISPRIRFDLIVNQFVLEAFVDKALVIYQGGYSRSYIHIYDVVQGVLLGLKSPDAKVRGRIFNLGSNQGNYTKNEIVHLICKHLPETQVRYKDLNFRGDMRDIRVSFHKVQRELGYTASRTVEDGIQEIIHTLNIGLIENPMSPRYRNAPRITEEEERGVSL